MNDKKLKGYQFDSLVYRYIRARESMAQLEYLLDKQSPQYNKVDFATYQKRSQRDISRFIEILNDTIGEHE